VDDGFGADDEGAERGGGWRGFGGGRFLPGGVEEPGEGLDGFAETHIVGEDAAEAVGGEMGEEVVSFFLIRAKRGAEFGGNGRGRCGGEGLGAFAERRGEAGVLGFEEVGFGGELEGVDAVGGGAAVGQDVVGREAEAVEGGGVGGVGGLDFEALPAVAFEADPFAAGLEEEREFVGGELGVFDAEFGGEVEPVASGGFGGGCSGKFDTCTERRAEEAGEAGGGVEGEIGRERGVPGDEFVGEVFGDGAGPVGFPRVPVESEVGEAGGGGAGGGEVVFEDWIFGTARGRGAGGGPLPAGGRVVLFEGKVGIAGDELGVELEGFVVARGGREPAFEVGAEEDAADVLLEFAREAEAGGAEARHEFRVAERGGGKRGVGRGRGAAPDLLFEKVERLGARGEKAGARGVATVGRGEAEFEAVGGVGGRAGVEEKRFGLDEERRSVGEDEGIARGAGAEKCGGDFGGKRLAGAGGVEAGADLGGERETEGGFGRREVFESRWGGWSRGRRTTDAWGFSKIWRERCGFR